MGTDSLYYIMDYSGNYYRLDHSDQLVAGACEQDASIFTFAQANSRIGDGKKSAFYCMIPVEEEPEESLLNEELADYADAKVQEISEADEYVSPVKELAYDEVTEQVEKNTATYNLSEMDWEEYLTHFTYLVDGIKEYRAELNKKYSDIDQKICDILHYIELCETNDEEAVNLVELLRVCRENRRDIKDELHRTEFFQNNIGTNANAVKARQALKSMKCLENRKYKPRKYKELFENCVLKDRRLRRNDIRVMEEPQERMQRTFYVEHTCETEGGAKEMMQEREYTPFDGKENDWLSFARQQAEFYRNAGQYISNLQVDIRAIDDEIEEILLGTEDANCNVTQGYKVFKRLKELRLERKAKTRELDCLYILTDYVDCEALADTCEANLTELETVMGISVQNNKTEEAAKDYGEEDEIENLEYSS